MIQKIAMIASVVLPLWNIPLIYRIIQRKSSRDVSLAWALGVWSCLLFMLPSGLLTTDPVWKVYTISNLGLFSAVVIVVLLYRNKN